MKKYLEKLNNYFSRYYTEPSELHKNQDPTLLLTHLRFDVILKIIYAEFYLGITKTKFNRILYYIHLKRLNNFKGKDSKKYNFKDYEKSFQILLDSIKERGFDSEITILPVDKYNKIIDGSHRLSASIVLRKGIDVIKFNSLAPVITLKRLNEFFDLKKNDYILSYLIVNYIKYNKNLKIITLFPVRDKKFDERCLNILKEYGDIILTKSIGIGNLTNGFHMVKNFYFGAKWIGNLENNYQGAAWKTKACFEKTNGIIDVLLFSPFKEEYGSIEHIKKTKEKIRSIYNIHFHSIHSSDNHEETIRYSKLFFNSNSQFYLTRRSKVFFIRFEKLLENLISSNIDHHNFVFSGSSVMGALGLREPKDFDIFHTLDFSLPNYLSSHNSQIKYLNKYSVQELIYNPRNYFFYMGYKFLNLKIILEMKVNRYQVRPKEKDYNDIKIIREFIGLI